VWSSIIIYYPTFLNLFGTATTAAAAAAVTTTTTITTTTAATTTATATNTFLWRHRVFLQQAFQTFRHAHEGASARPGVGQRVRTRVFSLENAPANRARRIAVRVLPHPARQARLAERVAARGDHINAVLHAQRTLVVVDRVQPKVVLRKAVSPKTSPKTRRRATLLLVLLLLRHSINTATVRISIIIICII
jgi:hypothetical protein